MSLLESFCLKRGVQVNPLSLRTTAVRQNSSGTKSTDSRFIPNRIRLRGASVRYSPISNGDGGWEVTEDWPWKPHSVGITLPTASATSMERPRHEPCQAHTPSNTNQRIAGFGFELMVELESHRS